MVDVERPHPDARHAVVFVGGFPSEARADLGGGQLSVCAGVLCSPIPQLHRLLTFDCTQTALPLPHIAVRSLLSLRRLPRFVRLIRRNEVAALIAMSGDRASAVEKGLMVMIARAFGRGTGFYLVAGGFLNDADRSPLWRAWGRLIVRLSDVLLCQGQSVADAYQEKLGASSDQCMIVPNLCDLEGWYPPDEDPHEEPPEEDGHVLFAGWMARSKGVFDLLHAIASSPLLARKRFVLCGDGVDMKDVEALVQRLGLQDCVSLRGWVDDAELHRLFRQASVFVLPSHREGFPQSVIQALASETAVVTTAVGTMPDYLVDQEHALLVPPERPPALRDALERVLFDEELRKRLQSAGRRLVEETFDARYGFAPLDAAMTRAAEHSRRPAN